MMLFRLDRLIIIAIGLMPACSSVFSPESQSPLTEIAESYSPPAGYAGIYVYRDKPSLVRTPLKIRLNGEYFGSIATGDYVYGWVSPGNNSVSADQKGSSDFGVRKFQAVSGNNYFFRAYENYEGKFIALGNSNWLIPIRESEARDRLGNFTLSAKNDFNDQASSQTTD